MPAAARLKCVAGSEWGLRRYLDATLLEEWLHGADPRGCRKVRKNLEGTRPERPGGAGIGVYRLREEQPTDRS